jgi:hypothetical protein
MLLPQKSGKVASMVTLLEKTLKRELSVGGSAYVLAISPDGLKLTLKGRRKGLELRWDALVSGDAALAVALNASLGTFGAKPNAPRPVAQPTLRSKAKLLAEKPKVARRATGSRRAGRKHKRGPGR